MNSALKIAERNQMGTFHSISIPNNVIYMYNVKIHAVHVNTACQWTRIINNNLFNLYDDTLYMHNYNRYDAWTTDQLFYLYGYNTKDMDIHVPRQFTHQCLLRSNPCIASHHFHKWSSQSSYCPVNVSITQH